MKYEYKYRCTSDLKDWILKHSTFYEYGEEVQFIQYRDLQKIVREIKKGNKDYQL